MRESESARIAREDAKYDALPETAKINVSNEYITFLHMFKYIGSKILYSLRDDDNIVICKHGTQEVCTVNKVRKYHCMFETVESVHSAIGAQRRRFC